jgi:hypothetical protein
MGSCCACSEDTSIGMTVEIEGSAPPESPDHVIATYREIAMHFALGGPNAARTKVKRAGWAAEHSNHPADPLRIRVPKDAWYQVSDPAPLRSRDIRNLGAARAAGSHSRHLKALEMAIETLREQLASTDNRADRAEAEAAQLRGQLAHERERTDQGRDAERARPGPRAAEIASLFALA